MFFAVLILIFLLDFVFVDTKELFFGGAKLASLLSDIAKSLIAGYMFYVVSSVKFDSDRIKRSQKASEIVVKRILSISSNFYAQLSSNVNQSHSPTPTLDKVKDLLKNKNFSDLHYGKIYSNFSTPPAHKTIHYFLFDDFVVRTLKMKSELELYFSIMEPEIQLAFCDYFNNKFFSTFGNITMKGIFKGSDHPISDFATDFFDISVTADKLKIEFERIYGKLEK